MGILPLLLMMAAQTAVAPSNEGLAVHDREVELMVLVEVSTRDAKPGTEVRLRLNKPVTLDGEVIPVGTLAFGSVEQVEGSGVALKRGTLSVRVSHLQHGDRRVPLIGDMTTRAQGGKHDDLAKLLLAPFHAPFAQGNSAKLRAGELINARFQDPVQPSPLAAVPATAASATP